MKRFRGRKPNETEQMAGINNLPPPPGAIAMSMREATDRGHAQQVLLDLAKQKLKESAVVRYDENMLATVIEMAMQMYPRWAKNRVAAASGS